jgi:hypothetical protein
VSFFAPLKRIWRGELDTFKEECVRENLRHATIPKDRYKKVKNVPRKQ